jgi:hypothetical protein
LLLPAAATCHHSITPQHMPFQFAVHAATALQGQRPFSISTTNPSALSSSRGNLSQLQQCPPGPVCPTACANWQLQLPSFWACNRIAR